jgi:hypothetical protein
MDWQNLKLMKFEENVQSKLFERPNVLHKHCRHVLWTKLQKLNSCPREFVQSFSCKPLSSKLHLPFLGGVSVHASVSHIEWPLLHHLRSEKSQFQNVQHVQSHCGGELTHVLSCPLNCDYKHCECCTTAKLTNLKEISKVQMSRPGMVVSWVQKYFMSGRE